MHAPPLRGVALAMNEPIGVVGVVCPDEAPLLAFISLVAPLIAMGNRVVVVPSERHPLAATDFYQVLETSDVPAGVVNIVTGGARAPDQDAGRARRCRCAVGVRLEDSFRDGGKALGRQPQAHAGRSWPRHRLERPGGRRRPDPAAPCRAGEEYLDSVRRIAKIGGTGNQGRQALLKNLDPLLNADVLHALRAMGHGDTLVLSDTNFPV